MDLIEVKMTGGFMGSRESLMFRFVGDDCDEPAVDSFIRKVLDDETWQNENDVADQILYRFVVHVDEDEWHSINMFESSVPDEVKDMMDSLAHDFQRSRNR